MRFKIDENLHSDVAELFAQSGYDVHTVVAEGLRGSDDMVVAQHCLKERRAIVTLDLDFADMRAFPPSLYAGLIVLRLGRQSRSNVMSIAARIIELLKHEPLAGRLWIVSDTDVRVRG